MTSKVHIDNLHAASSNDIVSRNSIVFPVTKFVPHEVSWINKSEFMQALGLCQINDVEQVFSEMFSYAIPSGETFSHLSFDHEEKKNYLAERYGGRGVGSNGGGVRCGTAGAFQVKGVGKNPLAGLSEDTWHSYGGLHASDAIYEAVYSYILDRIAPVGVASIYGVAITGKDAAYIGCEELEKGIKMSTWGALLVREAVERPAHYLRSPLYKVAPGSGICDDQTRVKIVNRGLLDHFGGTSFYIQFLGKFLSNCANQFAFGRMARIMHGSVTPSNLCMDGRWLDLTNTTFIGSGSNVAVGASPFYDEPMTVIPIVNELLYTFSKYNGVDLNPRPLVDYYIEQFDCNLVVHVCYIFSWDYDEIPEKIRKNQLSLLAEEINDLIVANGNAVGVWPSSLKEDDSILCLIKGLLIYEFDKEYGFSYILDNLSFSKEQLESICTAYIEIVASVLPSKKDVWTNFCARAIRSMKRCLYNEYFFKGRLEKYLNTRVVNSKSGLFEGVIEDLVDSADWIFDENPEKITLFSDNFLSVEYHSLDARILVALGNKHTYFELFGDFNSELLRGYTYDFVRSGHNFRGSLLEIVEIISHLEKGLKR